MDGGTIRNVATESQANGSDPDGKSELERFENLTKRLMKVPKTEMDAAMKRTKHDSSRRLRASKKKG